MQRSKGFLYITRIPSLTHQNSIFLKLSPFAFRWETSKNWFESRIRATSSRHDFISNLYATLSGVESPSTCHIMAQCDVSRLRASRNVLFVLVRAELGMCFYDDGFIPSPTCSTNYETIPHTFLIFSKQITSPQI